MSAAAEGLPPRALVKGLVMIAALVALGWAVKASGFEFNEAWIDEQVRGHGLSGELLFVAFVGISTAVGFPRQATAFLGGYAFGLVLGTLLSLLGAVLGCVASFYYARLLGRELVAHKFARRLAKIDRILSVEPFTVTVLIRFLPVGSNVLTNLLGGVSSVRALPFFAGSALGYVPQTLVFALLGTGVNVDPVLRTGAAVALFLASAVLGVRLFKRFRRLHKEMPALEEGAE